MSSVAIWQNTIFFQLNGETEINFQIYTLLTEGLSMRCRLLQYFARKHRQLWLTDKNFVYDTT